MSLFDNDSDGFYRGLLIDKAEKDAIHGVHKMSISNVKNNFNSNLEDAEIHIALSKRITSLSKTIEIKTMDELKELLQLKTVDAIIKKFTK